MNTKEDRLKRALYAADGARVCTRCKIVKPLDAFPARSGGFLGLSSRCYTCTNEVKTQQRKPQSAAQRRAQRFRTYSLNEAEFLAILDDQGWRCPICSTRLAVDASVIDHNHKTDIVRGVLCSNCNVGLGMLQDNAHNLRRAATYIEQSQ